jgi:hypothetical protein
MDIRPPPPPPEDDGTGGLRSEDFGIAGTLRDTRQKYAEPEKTLMKAVFDDAWTQVLRGCSKYGRRVQRLAREAEVWFLDDDEAWPFSFVNIAAALGLSVSAVRRRLREVKHLAVRRRPVAKSHRRVFGAGGKG